MKNINLDVRAAADGWGVFCDFPLEPTYFQSGARAEYVARGLAQRFARMGHQVKLVVKDRRDLPVALQIFGAKCVPAPQSAFDTRWLSM